MSRWMLLFLLFFIISCKNENQVRENPEVETGIKVKIVMASGQLYKNHNYLPLLGNLAMSTSESPVEILILGKIMQPGALHGIDPIGLLRYSVNGEENQLIVAIPTNSNFQSIKISDLVDLSVQYGSIKRIIEQWYGSFSGFGNNRFIGWENKSAALNVLNHEFSR